MLTKEEALKTVTDILLKRGPRDNPPVVVDAGTIEKPYGWVFFYNYKKYVETGILGYCMVGNGPVIVNKYDGTIQFFGTFKSPESFIEEYEQKLAKL